jgi:MoxR-like ATPase
MNDSRTVFGYLSKPFNNTVNEQGKIDRGLIKILFEEINNTLYPINSNSDFDSREEVYILDGFESLLDKYQQKILKINAIPNTNDTSEGQTKYVTFKNQVSEVKNEICSFIKCDLPDPLNLDISLPSAPHSKIFYLVDAEFAYGPFLLERIPGLNNDINDCNGKLRPLTGKANGFPNLKPGFLYKMDFENIKKEFNKSFYEKDGVFYLTDLQLIYKIKKDQIEFTTQQNIVEMFNYMANKRIISAPIVTSIKKELNAMKIGPATRGAVLSVVENAASNNDEWRDQLFDVIEKETKGKALIEEAVANQQHKYERQWLEKTKVDNESLVKEAILKNKELEDIKEYVVKEERRLFKVQQDIEKKIEQLEHESGFQEELTQKKLTADAELESKKKELSELSSKYKELKSIDDLEKKLKELSDDIKSEQRREITLEDTIKKLKKDIEESDTVLQIRLRDMVPYVSSIIQAPIPVKENKTNLDEQILAKGNEEPNAELASNIVNGICTQFSKHYDREYSPALVASILVAYHQNFMTIFSGPPGLGKTSFVRIFSKILNLGNRFKEVAVGRAWTSDREFIGFYNSLTDTFSPASSGMYQYLKGVENDVPKNATSQLILLDEANLSPIEHYASILLNVADLESERVIPAGKGVIKLPSSLRVIGTVNHDMTTEPLSARLLDRSPVIPFDFDFDFDNDETPRIETECELNYSSQIFLDLFGIDSKITDNSITDDTIIKIVDILKDKKSDWGLPFIISKRKQKNIRKYIEVLTPVLLISCSLSYQDALNSACDYATLFFLLPPISGNGTGLELRLIELRTTLSALNLKKSEAKIDDMLNRGKYHLDTFNYFNY